MARLIGIVFGLSVDERGQTLVEYVLLLVLIAIVVMLMLTGLGGNVNNALSSVNSAMP